VAGGSVSRRAAAWASRRCARAGPEPARERAGAGHSDGAARSRCARAARGRARERARCHAAAQGLAGAAGGSTGAARASGMSGGW
jgi:hypothetical protein